jgi:hypothetical protein
MCTFRDERAVVVCDVAIGQVKKDLERAFGGQVRYTSIEGQGTLVEAEPEVDGSGFTNITRAAVRASQNS